MFQKLAQELRDYVETSAAPVTPVTPAPAAPKPKPTPAPKTNRLDTAQFDEAVKLWRLIGPEGYMRLYQDKPTPRNYFKYEYEHRKVLAEALGRALLTSEIAHHKDGNKLNNVAENLELALNHIEHMRQHPEWRQRKII